ncbi:SDR family oxidoreductase [Gaopeijia maritima]|uniref:SDR family oxidoreductase n=1 Tax=Gaopeijia maritima TaxID=3119007 RepID=A0ABU9EAD4_9BACT
MSPVALVTGAAGGIGRAVVTTLLADGCRVVATDVDEAGLLELEAEVARDHLAQRDDRDVRDGHPHQDRLRTRRMDVTDEAEVEGVVAETEAEWGPIERAALVAGIIEIAPALETSTADYRRILEVNAFGVFVVARAVGARMAERGAGAIVTVGSNAGLTPRVGMTAYGASKAAASMITRTLGLELARSGVRCNVVCAGSTRTPMQRRFQGEIGGDGPVIEGSLADFRTGIPLGRIAEPTDVADAVAYLLSDRARQITMTELVVDGGASLRS